MVSIVKTVQKYKRFRVKTEKSEDILKKNDGGIVLPPVY